MPEKDNGNSDIAGAHVFPQGVALTGFFVRSPALQRIRLEKTIMSGVDVIAKACVLIVLLDI
jgi:hypothetical protein